MYICCSDRIGLAANIRIIHDSRHVKKISTRKVERFQIRTDADNPVFKVVIGRISFTSQSPAHPGRVLRHGRSRRYGALRRGLGQTGPRR